MTVTVLFLLMFLGDKADGFAPEQPRSKEDLKADRLDEKDIQEPIANVQMEEQKKDADVGLLAPEMKIVKAKTVLQNSKDLNTMEKAPEPNMKKTNDLPALNGAENQQQNEVKIPPAQVVYIQKAAQEEQAALKKQNQVKSRLKNQNGDFEAKENKALPGRPVQKIAVDEHVLVDKVAKIAAGGLKQNKAPLQEGAGQKDVEVKREQELQRPSSNHNVVKEQNLIDDQADAKVGMPGKDRAMPAEAEKIPGDDKMEDRKDEAAPDNEQGKANRDLKLQNDLDLRRRKRELANEDLESDGAHIIAFNHAPNPRVNDLHTALETHLNAEAGMQVVYSRQIKQLAEKER